MPSPSDLLSGLQGLPRIALGYVFKDLSDVEPPTNEEERQELLRRLEFYSAVEAGALGLFSGLLLVLVTAIVEARKGTFSADPTTDQYMSLGFVLLLGTVITVLELVVMYYLSLRNARTIAIINQQSTSKEEIDEQVMFALVNAGLQTPNLRTSFHGIDPRADLPRWKVVLAAVFLKTKVSISRTVIKLMWRRFAIRVLGRSLSRGVLELASLPVFVFWNMWVIRQTVSELRYRSELPLREDDALSFMLGNDGAADADVVLRTTAEHIYIVGDVHPNVERLFTGVLQTMGMEDAQMGQRQRLRPSDVAKLTNEQRLDALRTLSLLMAVDPRHRRAHTRLLRALLASIETQPMWSVKDLQKMILKGQSFPSSRS